MNSVNSIPMTQLVKEYQQNVWQKVSVPRAFSSCRKDGALMGEPGVAKVIFVYELCKTPDLLHEFLRKAGLLKKDLTCAKCNSPMKLRSKDINDGAVWTCRNRIDKKECGLQKSVRFGSWFSCSKLTMGGPFDAEFTMSYITGPHMDTGQWLKKLDLKEYNDIFKSYNGVEDILSLSERELKSLGVKNGSHRTRMMASLIVLRDKYDRADSLIRSVTAPSSVRHSLVHSRESVHSRFCPCLRSQRYSVPVSRRSSGRFSMEPLTGTEASPEELKKALEWELSLDNNDLRSHAWYHGTIPRPRAEELMSEEGDFLIRDCISRPGDYVLTCRWRSASLHFVINKVVFQPFTVYERIQYQFEDDCFDTVPDLVTYYVGNKRPISAASGAVIMRPVNRSMPLSYYATRYGLECQMHYAALALEKVAGSQESLPEGSGSGENCLERRLSQPAEVSKLKEEIHQSGVATMPRSVSDYPRKSVPNFSTLQHGSGLHSKREISSSPISLEKKELKNKSSQESVPDVFITQEEGKEDLPPPKPSRIPSKKYSTTYSSSGDSKSSSNDTPPPPHLYSELNFMNKPLNGNVQRLEGTDSKNTPDWTSVHVKIGSIDGQDDSNRQSRVITIPEVDPPSSFDMSSFSTVLLLSENKPLDPPALAKMRCMLLEGGARVIASHLTRDDLDVLKLNQHGDLGVGVLTGFELLVLPQGQQLRLDLLERTECLKFFVAITVLTCGDEDVRAQVLNKWIQIAIETKTALGNLYGFTGIMQGLALPQISRLRSTWLKLRQSCTENAFMYETKLRPTLKNMQECSNPQAPNTCIPYLLSLILILQRHLDMQSSIVCPEESEEKPSGIALESLSSLNKEKAGKVHSLGLQWEQTAADYGLQLLLTHLEIGRAITQQWPMYKRNSEIVLEHVKYDDLMLDMFRTEFQMKFLWGSKGCYVAAKERYSKFSQVLDVMSERCEPE
ncbi:breast cancer anti-estrogen resistance protein 3 homolog [Nephila pilipes]|uniref:Breast cancer anti-estrogen resistance protein 3 homolog n=1 Tax=Nephila pilipes TaxID=299642 RepID=A0A8X6PKI1_NEPPI|nr:breast cancer anti-estrogen resistance protein 3 homolog [Nephila pilipes]